MRNIILGLFLVCTFLFSGVKAVNVTPSFIDSGIKIIDIRTEAEWVETGVIKNSILITFFEESGKYDAQKFIMTLEENIKEGEAFALICRTGNRTTSVADFLGKNGYKVINLKGGIISLKKQGYELNKYLKKN